MRHHLKIAACAGMFVTVGMTTSRASATFHEWRMEEIYSNSTGTIQFIELEQAPFQFDDERFVGGQSLTESALGHSYVFPANLPAAPTAGSHFLVATPGYAALSGVPTADYVLPLNTWFKVAGDTLTFATFVDNLTFTGAQLPVDGSLSLKRAYGASVFTTSANSPTNFAGATGTVPGGTTPEPTTLAVLAGTWIAMGTRRRRQV